MTRISVTVKKVGLEPHEVSLSLGSSYNDAIEKANREADGLFVLKPTQEVRFNGTVVTQLDNEIPCGNGMIVISNRTDSGQ